MGGEGSGEGLGSAGRLEVLALPIDELDLVGEYLLEVDVELAAIRLEHIPPVTLGEGDLVRGRGRVRGEG